MCILTNLRIHKNFNPQELLLTANINTYKKLCYDLNENKILVNQKATLNIIVVVCSWLWCHQKKLFKFSFVRFSSELSFQLNFHVGFYTCVRLFAVRFQLRRCRCSRLVTCYFCIRSGFISHLNIYCNLFIRYF